MSYSKTAPVCMKRSCFITKFCQNKNRTAGFFPKWLEVIAGTKGTVELMSTFTKSSLQTDSRSACRNYPRETIVFNKQSSGLIFQQAACLGMQCWRHRSGWEDKCQLWVCPFLKTLPLFSPLGTHSCISAPRVPTLGTPSLAVPAAFPHFPPPNSCFHLSGHDWHHSA